MLAAGSLVSIALVEVMRETRGVSSRTILQVATILAEVLGAEGLAGGQMMDLVMQEKENASLLDLEWIHMHKTAALIKAAVASGAILGGATPEQVEALEEYALNIGLAFQVVDDILDIESDSETLGKTAGKDEALDKLTYPKLLGLQGAKAEANILVGKAKSALEPFGDNAQVLLQIADFVLDRNS